MFFSHQRAIAVRNNFGDGTEVDFDRYTLSTHEMSESMQGQPHWAPVCEIVTRRGAYLGLSPASNAIRPNAAHLLPRGMSLRCVGIKAVSIIAPDGRREDRLVLQMEDNL